MAMALAVAGLTLGATAPASAAPPPRPNNLEDVQAATYNMQGAGSGDDVNKWTKDLPQLLAAGYNMIAVQEAGPGQAVPGANIGSLPTAPGAERVQVHEWNRGNADNPDIFYIYYLRTDFGGNRVNLAIVTPWLTNQIRYAPNPGRRPSFGIEIGNATYWTVHADSRGGQQNNAESTLQAIQGAAPNNNWLAMGDWNRDPDVRPVNAPAGAMMYRSAQYTVGFYGDSPSEADYMFAGRQLTVAQGYEGVRLNAMTSDHAPVGLLPARLRAAAGAVELRSRSNDERRLAVPYGDEANQTDLITYRPSSRTGGQSAVPAAGPEQTWRLRPSLKAPAGYFTLVNQQTGKCMDVHNGTEHSRDRVDQWDCAGQSTQEWVFEPSQNDSATGVLRNLYHSNSCLDVFRGDKGDGAEVGIYECNGTANQQWELASRESSTLASVSNGDRLLDVDGASHSNDARVITHTDNGGANQRWHLDASGPGTVTVVNEESGKCLDIANGTDSSAGDAVDQYACEGQFTQEWEVEPAGNGSVRLVNDYYGWELDVLGNLTGEDRPVGVSPGNGQTNQLWRLDS
ncbi:RICIN domain-containing protein [Streptomyces sp. NPDC050844]|uniref:RICIN domain-containing protein n=1 Tax=Streptomyces sp. NPDC050844 TaxID=3155790 RepID=UPI0033D7AF57